ncbi:MAG: NAD-dependent epimerase/dehydratase family protein, partial [Phycisphaerae bacterium]
MRYLITGGAGFLGRCITRQLTAGGVAMTDIHILRSKDCDLTRQEATEAMVARLKPDVILHLAAQVGGIGANRE